MLLQGAHNDRVITLLKDTHDGTISLDQTESLQCQFIVVFLGLLVLGVVIKRRRVSTLTDGSQAKTKGFGSVSLQNGAQKCHLCGKTVYAMEFVGAADKVRYWPNDIAK